MLADVDLFNMFRWVLGTVCTIYALVVSWQSLWAWLNYFSSSRNAAVLGRYAFVLLVRLKLRRFAGDLAEIGLLLAMLGGIVYVHRHVG